jgi:pimeloyl-ACP methyl ester carboxylesterase
VPHATNPVDGLQVYFEDDGGAGAPVVFHGGVLDRVEDVRESGIARALPPDEFRSIFVDHRGLGQSEKPRDPSAYVMPRRAADAVAVLDELGIERAHFVGMSWGGRLGFGIGAIAPARVRSLVVGGQQPYAWPNSPLTRIVVEALADSATDDTEALVRGFERFWNVTFPAEQRARWVDNDRLAVRAAITTALSEGAVATDLATWQVPCLIFMGASDTDFLDDAKRAAAEIPNAELLVLEEADHYEAHVTRDDLLIDAVLRKLRASR